jgi:HEAT repeat protein
VWTVLLGSSLLLVAGLVLGAFPRVKQLVSPSPTVNGHTVEQLARDLSDPDPAKRKKAIIALGRLDTEATGTVTRLAELLRNDPDPLVRAAAGDALRKMVPACRSVVNELAAALSDPEPLVRMNAAMTLAQLKGDARPAVPALILAAKDEGNGTNLNMYFVTIRDMSLRALGDAAAGTPDAVPVLLAALDNPETDMTRLIAVHGLGLAGPHALETAPALRGMLRDFNPDVRQEAETALTLIGASRDGPERQFQPFKGRLGNGPGPANREPGQ